MARKKADFPEHIYVVREQGNDEEWLQIHLDLTDMADGIVVARG